jgi:predicted transposase/invertase (TIGR01784 family)
MREPRYNINTDRDAMTRLEYTFTNDTLFKTLFVQYPDLLKRLVAELLNISIESIGEFRIVNPEMPPEIMGDKFCRLDINMIVDEQRVDLEIQVSNEGDYPARSLYYWAKEFSSALKESGRYSGLPRTIIISILAFKLFDCEDFHSEFQLLEVTRKTALTDKQVLHYFELPKLPEVVNADDRLRLWLALFNAETEEELSHIEEMGVPVMEQAIKAYRRITATDEFREIERLRFRARYDEISALSHAEEVGREKGREEGREEGMEVGAEREREKWQDVVAEKDVALANKEVALAEKDALIAELRARLGGGK